MHRYIQIDENGYVIGVHFNSVPFDNPLYIQYDNEIEGDLFKKRYVDGEFIDIEPEPEPTPTPSVTMEQINENQLTIMEALTDLYMTVSEMGVE